MTDQEHPERQAGDPKGSGKQFSEEPAKRPKQPALEDAPPGSGKEFARGQAAAPQGEGEVPKGSGKQFGEDRAAVRERQTPGTPKGSGKQFGRDRTDERTDPPD